MSKYTPKSTNNHKIDSDDVTPVKVKSKAEWHYCYVCREWHLLPIEDFRMAGHYSKNKVKELADKSNMHKVEFQRYLSLPVLPLPSNAA